MSEMSPQRLILARWLDALQQIPQVEVVWLEGSLVDDARANLGSDIDMRLAISDQAYEALWSRDKSVVLAGLGPTLRLIDADWIRALTEQGYIVEIAAYKTSKINGLELAEWEFLLNRLPTGQPAFKKLPPMTAAEAWAEEEPLTREFVWRQSEIAFVVMANAAGPYDSGEFQSAKFALDDMRTNLLKLMYRRVGVYFAKRHKHLSEVLPADFRQDLASTSMRTVRHR